MDACGQKRACSQEDYTKERESEKDTAHPDSPTLPSARTNPTDPSPTVSVKSGAKQSARHESAELEPAVRLAKQAMALAQGGQPGRTKRRYAGDGKPRPRANTLVSSFVKEIGPVLGDRNLKGSVTRALRIAEACGLTDLSMETLACLVRAYWVAKDARKINEEHIDRETGQEYRMPYFLTMFKTFAGAWVKKGNWEYTNDDLEADIERDDRLVLWLAECGLQLQVLSDPAAAQSEELAEATITQDDDQGVATTSEALFPQEEGSVLEQGRMPVTRCVRTAEDKQARVAYARKVRDELRKGGVSEMLAAMVDSEHPCGCPLFWDTENNWRWKCAHCSPHAGWSRSVRALIASILEQ